MFFLKFLLLPWFFMKPKSASSLWHISQVKHFGCHEPFIALITLPTMNSPKIELFRKYQKFVKEGLFKFRKLPHLAQQGAKST